MWYTNLKNIALTPPIFKIQRHHCKHSDQEDIAWWKSQNPSIWDQILPVKEHSKNKWSVSAKYTAHHQHTPVLEAFLKLITYLELLTSK